MNGRRERISRGKTGAVESGLTRELRKKAER